MPEVTRRQCAECGELLDATMASLGMLTHPACSMAGIPTEASNPAVVTNLFDTEGAVPLPQLAADLQAEFTTMIRWHEEFSPRAQQVSLGPSDLGIECDRRLAYKVAGIRGDHTGDPWPAAVGTSIHKYLENVVKKYGQNYGNIWQTEQKIQIDPLISGRADLIRPPTVADIKTTGPDMLKKVVKSGPPDSYKIQINLYAKGLRDAGIDITQVAFLFFPRSGWLKDIFVWAAPYDEQIALKAIRRPYELAAKLTELQVMDNPHRWEQIPANPSYLCAWCPLYNRHISPEEGASDRGCPGYRSKGTK